jgi:protein-S-isoprenylcysteine O-methyltransferase Ste14
MQRLLIFVFGLVAYAVFFATICYAIGFVGNYAVPKGIDHGVTSSSILALLLNSTMLGVFAVQHTIMARRGFKQWIAQYIPQAIERSTFVLVASLILAATFWLWIPIPGVVWSIDQPAIVAGLTMSYFFGWFLVFFASFLINHFDLFGLRQSYLAWRNVEYRPVVFRKTFLYNLVRHPLLLGFLVAFWSAPVMTEGRLLFALLTTAYIFVGIRFEERDLVHEHGEQYLKYQREVPMLVPSMK